MIGLIGGLAMRLSSYAWLSTAGTLTFMDFMEGHYSYGLTVLILAYHYETMKPENNAI